MGHLPSETFTHLTATHRNAMFHPEDLLPGLPDSFHVLVAEQRSRTVTTLDILDSTLLAQRHRGEARSNATSATPIAGTGARVDAVGSTHLAKGWIVTIPQRLRVARCSPGRSGGAPATGPYPRRSRDGFTGPSIGLCQHPILLMRS